MKIICSSYDIEYLFRFNASNFRSVYRGNGVKPLSDQKICDLLMKDINKWCDEHEVIPNSCLDGHTYIKYTFDKSREDCAMKFKLKWT